MVGYIMTYESGLICSPLYNLVAKVLLYMYCFKFLVDFPKANI